MIKLPNYGGAKYLSIITGRSDEKLESKIKQLFTNIRLKLAIMTATLQQVSTCKCFRFTLLSR